MILMQREERTCSLTDRRDGRVHSGSEVAHTLPVEVIV